uniref:Extended FMRFamide-2 n=1 Tax=Tyrannophasma gladiator TaxID=270861 RepID=FAR2_TYRGL|nr:RecName: Full=Extended FMRFamide-2; Short=FMRFa-2 [Tyrannophasma gladiator]
ADYLRLARA